MAGHVEDRWWRDKENDDGNVVLNAKGKAVREKTDLYGKGMRYRVRYYVNKRERSKSFPDGKKRQADDFLTEVEAGQLSGVVIDPRSAQGREKVRLRAYVEQYLNGQSDDPNTQKTYKSKLENVVFAFFGDPFLEDISHERIRSWLVWMQDKGGKRPLSANYRGQVFDMLRAILRAAEEEELIEVNPCNARSIKRPKAERRKIAPWTEEKLWKIERALLDPYKIVVPVGSGLGLRQMEIIGFSPDDINRTKMEVDVVRQLKWVDGVPVFGAPKGGKSRVVPIGDGLLGEIDRYVDDHEPVTVSLPWERPTGDLVTVRLLINKAADGIRRPHANEYRVQFWQGDGFLRAVWQPAFSIAGLTYGKRRDGLHALRHLFASFMLEQGVSIKELSEYLGHRDPAFTLRIYTHMMPSSHERARIASDKVFKSRPLANAA
jgi:integrase